MSSHSKSLEDRAAARVGTTIHGKYRLERLLGIGGMAAVYAGAHRNGNRVALKVLHPELGIDVDVRSRFLREGYVANKVNHPGAVRVLDDDTTDDGAVFLVMELLEGEGVDARWERAGRRLPVEHVCAIGQQLLSVLAAAHAQHVIHRDIKPENLFVTTGGIVKVLDFGIARLRERESSALTGTGRTMGTPAYMPPEQARGRRSEVDGRTDLWAAGATMFTLVAGQYVHQAAETTEELLVFAATQSVQPLALVAPDVPAPIAAVVDRALSFAKSDRWPNAIEMGIALEEAFFAAYGRPLAAIHLTPEPAPAPARAGLTAAHRSEHGTGGGGTSPGVDDTQPASVVRLPRASSSAPAASAKASTTAGVSRDGGVGPFSRRSLLVSSALVLFLAVVGFGVARGLRAPPALPLASAGSSMLAAPDSATEEAENAFSAAAPATGTAAVPRPPESGSRRPLGPPLLRPRVVSRPPSPAPAATSSADCPLESYVETVKGEPVTRFRRACQ